MAELIDLGKHQAAVASEALKASMAEDRLAHWKQNAVPGLHIPMAFPPCVAFADGTLEDQVAHLFSEARELADDLADPQKSQDGTWLLELMDLHHSLETLERKITNAFGAEALNTARVMVIEKNAARGYYLAPGVDG